MWFYRTLLYIQVFCCCCKQGKNKHLSDNRHTLVDLALFRRACGKVLTDICPLFCLPPPSLPVVMLWAIMLLPPASPACSPATTAISGCSTVMPYQL